MIETMTEYKIIKGQITIPVSEFNRLNDGFKTLEIEKKKIDERVTEIIKKLDANLVCVKTIDYTASMLHNGNRERITYDWVNKGAEVALAQAEVSEDRVRNYKKETELSKLEKEIRMEKRRLNNLKYMTVKEFKAFKKESNNV